MPLQVGRGPIAAFVGAVVVGGLNFVAVRYSNEELTPFWGAGLQTAAAAVVMLASLLLLRIPFPRGTALLAALAYGLLTFGAATAFGYWGLQKAPAGLGSVLTSLAPLLTIVVAAAHGIERLDRRRVLGGLLAATGVAFVFADSLGNDVPVASQLALVISVLCFCEAAVLLKVLPRSHPVAVNAVGMSAGAAFLVTLAAVAGEPIRLPAAPSTWLAVVYLAIGSVLLFTLYLYLLGRWDASAASFVFVLFPFVTISVGSVFRGEHVGPSFVIGAAVAAAGVYLGAVASRSAPSVRRGVITEDTSATRASASR